MKKFIIAIALLFSVATVGFASVANVTSDWVSGNLVFKEAVTGNGAQIHFGENGDGLDVKFFADTSGAYMLWDESADKLSLSGVDIGLGDNDKIKFGAGVDLQVYSDGTNGIISGSSVKLYGQTFSTCVRIGTIAAGTGDERPVFVAPFDCQLVSVTLVNASAIATDAVSFTTISLRDKGSDGTADNQIAAISTDTTAFTAFDGVSMGTLDATHKLLTSGDVVTLKKADTAGGEAIDEMIVAITYKRR